MDTSNYDNKNTKRKEQSGKKNNCWHFSEFPGECYSLTEIPLCSDKEKERASMKKRLEDRGNLLVKIETTTAFSSWVPPTRSSG